MITSRAILSVGLAAVVASACLAATKPPKTTNKPSQPASKGTRRYNPVVERAKFHALAGPDSELDAKEFASARGKSGGFARKSDNWSALLKFDADGSKTIDWFEADAYRRSLGKRKHPKVTTIDGREYVAFRDNTHIIWARLVKKYDKNRDGKLTGNERKAADREFQKIRAKKPKPKAVKTRR